MNIFNYLREILKIPDQGGDVNSGKRYKLHRGNLAMNFLFMLNFDQFVEMPRQHGKTIAALARYLWVYNFGTSNSEIMFMHKDHGGSKNNLKTLKVMRDALPSYLQMSSATGFDGKKLKVPNTVVTMQHPYNNIVYKAAVPAFSTASKNAARNGAPYGILLTTTPGDLTTDSGQFAFQMRNMATRWNEKYYDLNYQELVELRKSNTNSTFFLVSYTYQQLGSGQEYLKEMVKYFLGDYTKLRREVLLEWSETSDDCPFSSEDLDIIQQYVKDPIRTLFFGQFKQYQFQIYEDLDTNYPPIIGVDVAGATWKDSSCITVIDSRTTRVTATLNCNYMPADDLAQVLYELVTKYLPNGIINVERNGVAFQQTSLRGVICVSFGVNCYEEGQELNSLQRDLQRCA